MRTTDIQSLIFEGDLKGSINQLSGGWMIWAADVSRRQWLAPANAAQSLCVLENAVLRWVAERRLRWRGTGSNMAIHGCSVNLFCRSAKNRSDLHMEQLRLVETERHETLAEEQAYEQDYRTDEQLEWEREWEDELRGWYDDREQEQGDEAYWADSEYHF